MRTTLTLDDDVAALLERLRERRNATLKAVVNEALRLGLSQIADSKRPGGRYVQRTVSVGGCRLTNVDDVAEVLAIIEEEDHR
jgi:hypothetical protein